MKDCTLCQLVGQGLGYAGDRRLSPLVVLIIADLDRRWTVNDPILAQQGSAAEWLHPQRGRRGGAGRHLRWRDVELVIPCRRCSHTSTSNQQSKSNANRNRAHSHFRLATTGTARSGAGLPRNNVHGRSFTSKVSCRRFSDASRKLSNVSSTLYRLTETTVLRSPIKRFAPVIVRCNSARSVLMGSRIS